MLADRPAWSYASCLRQSLTWRVSLPTCNRLPTLLSSVFRALQPGIFQEYGTKEVVPGWDKIKPGLTQAELTNPMRSVPEFKQVYEPLVRGGVQDVHGLNVGPKGQLIDYQYQLPKDSTGMSWTAGMAGSGPKITPQSQGLLGNINMPHKLPTQAYGVAQNMTQGQRDQGAGSGANPASLP
jgi:hypothetical protein